MSYLIRFCYFLLATGIISAAPPTNDGIFPCGGKAGTEIETTLSGKASPWPPEFWCSNPLVSFVPAEKTPKVTVKIDPKAKPGPCLIRTWNNEGTSEPFIFYIDEPTENLTIEDEKQPNRSITEAQAVETNLPCVVYGRLNPTKDVDCYRIDLKKGQTLHAFVEGYTFRGGIDCVLHLYNPGGLRTRITHDNVLTPDPELTYEATESGPHILAIMAIATPPNANVHFHGSTKSTYRINLALKKSDIPLRLHPAKGKPDADLSKPLTAPIDIFHTLKTGSPRVKATFSAKAKESFKIGVNAYKHRYPTDPVFIIKTKDDKLIREVDDGKNMVRDAEYLLKIPTDGNYSIEIRDRYFKTGADYRYQLTVQKPPPSFTGTVEKSSYTIDPGKEAAIKVKLTRLDNHKTALKLTIDNLPKGVSFKQPEIPEKTGDITIKLNAALETKPFSGPVKISLTETEGDSPVSKICPFTFQNKDARGPYLIDETADIWLTIKESNPPEGPAAAKN